METSRERQRRNVVRREAYKIMEKADDLRARGQRAEADQLEMDHGLHKPATPDPALEAVQETLDLLHAGRIDETYEALWKLDQQTQLLFLNKVPPEDQEHLQALLEREGQDLTQQLRLQGRAHGRWTQEHPESE